MKKAVIILAAMLVQLVLFNCEKEPLPQPSSQQHDQKIKEVSIKDIPSVMAFVKAQAGQLLQVPVYSSTSTLENREESIFGTINTTKVVKVKNDDFNLYTFSVTEECLDYFVNLVVKEYPDSKTSYYIKYIPSNEWNTTVNNKLSEFTGKIEFYTNSGELINTHLLKNGEIQEQQNLRKAPKASDCPKKGPNDDSNTNTGGNNTSGGSNSGSGASGGGIDDIPFDPSGGPGSDPNGGIDTNTAGNTGGGSTGGGPGNATYEAQCGCAYLCATLKESCNCSLHHGGRMAAMTATTDSNCIDIVVVINEDEMNTLLNSVNLTSRKILIDFLHTHKDRQFIKGLINEMEKLPNFTILSPAQLIRIYTAFKQEKARVKSEHPDWYSGQVNAEVWLNIIQMGLDVVGMIPVAGEIADLTNGVIYLVRGDKLNATLSFAATIPVAGWGATITKVAIKVATVKGATVVGGTKIALAIFTKASKYSFGSRGKLATVIGAKIGEQAHHIIPWKLSSSNIVQKAAEKGFHMNDFLNGISLKTYTIKNGGKHGGSHPKYDDVVEHLIEEFKKETPNYTPKMAKDFLETELIPELLVWIKKVEKSNLNLNEYFKQVVKPYYKL